MHADFTTARREQMVAHQIRRRGIHDGAVLQSMANVPRHRFAPDEIPEEAYGDTPIPIGRGQTISQPYIVALTTEIAAARPGCRALDVGTGSGYQAAILAEIVEHVYSVEIIPELAAGAQSLLLDLGYDNITIQCGDGSLGWPEHAPFDLIVAAAAAPCVPPALLEQLVVGGRLVIPIGRFHQTLVLYEKQTDATLTRTDITGVRFVPMTGQAGRAIIG